MTGAIWLILIFLTLTKDDKVYIDTLFLQQQEKMYRLSYRILGSKQDAEDAIGEAFIKIMDNIEKIKELPCHETVPYCVVVVRNCCMDILRGKKKAVPTEQIDRAEDDGLTTEDECFKGEDVAVLASLMTKLSQTDRQLLRLHYMDELSYREISKLLNISEVATRKREQRALQKLRELYREEVGEA